MNIPSFSILETVKKAKRINYKKLITKYEELCESEEFTYQLERLILNNVIRMKEERYCNNCKRPIDFLANYSDSENELVICQECYTPNAIESLLKIKVLIFDERLFQDYQNSIFYNDIIACLKKYKNSLEKLGIQAIAKYIKSTSETEIHFNEPTLQFLQWCYLESKYTQIKEMPSGIGFIDFLLLEKNQNKVIIETKLASNAHYLDGYLSQLPKYLNNEQSKYGIFVLFNQEKSGKTCEELEIEINNNRKIIEEKFPEFRIYSLVIDLKEEIGPSQIHFFRELEEIKGVGATRAKKLFNANIKNLKDIAKMDIDAIEKNTSIDRKCLLRIQKNANEDLEKSNNNE